MKKLYLTLFVTVVAIAASSLSLLAMPISSSNIPFDYIVSGRDLAFLSVGAYGVSAKRDIEWDGFGNTQKLSMRNFYGYVGVDLQKWITIYGLIGQSESKFGEMPYGDAENSYGGGIRLNLLHHFIREPVPMEDVVRVNLGAQFVRNEAESGFSTVEWDEVSAAVTMGLVNHTDGNKLFTPESIGFYAGPIYSTFVSDDFEAKDEFGIVAGMEIFFMDTITLDIELQHFEKTSVGGGINFHF